ncbi:dihydrodipicolinate synthase family protein [Sphingobacterium olei]|uniref:Dihydrodipicolinate synthase family protein n=1 Tax=Sphingobacterium olei TaxID=2571155 RepID=A0A4U0P6K4_9SPHI|nr:dihydrodipicolinate synthase family protein [Sphingobacterium olei]TJZ63075.1 dihydrodipicolinate synthase family protein [Sphingobacterium olei]
MDKLDLTIKEHLLRGTVIPAHPLALDAKRNIDEQRQRRLTRYYLATGAGGIAVGVHSTQFEIRDPKINLLETVLQWAAEEVERFEKKAPFVKIAGICGPTEQALTEASLARKYGYDMGLLSMGGLQGMTEEDIIKRTRMVAQVIPVFGFYLQPSVGGRVFSYDFWREFAEIENVEAIKCASFNRYQTLDVMRAVAHSSRRMDIAMYTGNDDNIVADLLTPYRFNVDNNPVEIGFRGGLLGHWAVWTHKAVELMAEIQHYRSQKTAGRADDLLARGIQITDVNAALFDPGHGFHGCIPGIHEVLRRQELLVGRWCLNPDEDLSPGQLEEIDRVYNAYPHLHDDLFVKDFLVENG